MCIFSQRLPTLLCASILLVAGFWGYVTPVHAAAGDWDVIVTLDDDNNVTVGDINEFTINVVNDELNPPGYDDTNVTVIVTLPLGLVFFAEGTYSPPGSANLVSTGGGILNWNIPNFFSLDDINIGYQVEITATGSLLTNVEVTPSGGAVAEGGGGTGNNTYDHTIIAVNTPIDGVCGTDDGQTYYSGHIFTDQCGTGVVLPSPPNFSYASGWDWQCLSPNGGDDADCTANVRYCGDVVNDPEEQCDTGIANDDGICYASGSSNGIGCTFTMCGDGITQNLNGAGTGGTTNIGDEECDDGANGDDTDGCTDSCVLTYCGDGILQNTNGAGTGGATNTGDEECDDGAGPDDDGCNTTCQTTFNGVCGADNGSDFYDVSPDGSELTGGSATLCSGTIATGFVYTSTGHVWDWTCLGSTNGGSDIACGATETYCGDSNPDIGDGEACDDGPGPDDDGCNTSCELTYNGICGSVTSGAVYDFEGDGTNLTGGSANLCGGASTATGFVYSGAAHVWDWTCAGSSNGGSNIACNTNEIYCGDLNLDGANGEACDDGPGPNDDGCNTICELTYNGTCGSDDGSSIYDLDGDGSMLTSGSANLCSIGTGNIFVYSGAGHTRGWDCLGSLNGGSDSTCGATERYCSDSVVDAGDAETCDYGDTTPNDGCSAVCQWEVPSCTMSITPGTGLAPLPVVSSPNFDTWAVIQSMDWLDGTVNTATGHTYVATGSFSATLTVANQLNGAITNMCSDLVQVNTVCGNSLVEIGEQCDDGGANGIACSPPYGGNCTYCSATCRDTIISGSYCGDGTPDLGDGEQCDDGNGNNNDACPNDCQLAVCGDTIVEGLEACDDGNLIDDDECDNACSLTSPPRYFGSSSSSSFVATTQSVIDDSETESGSGEVRDEEEKEPVDYFTRIKRIQALKAKKITKTKEPLDIRAYLKKRNISIRDIIKNRNLLIATLVSFRDYLKARNAVIIEETKPKVERASPPVVVSPRAEYLPVKHVPATRKSSIMVALQEYNKNKE